jgi:hypothetical protein
VLAERERTEAGQTDLVSGRYQLPLRPLRGANRLESPVNQPEEDRERDIFFLAGARVVLLPQRKQVLQKSFGFGAVHRADPEVPREPETIGVFLERTFVHNIMEDQKMRWRAGVRAIDSADCNDRTCHPG